jgi:hypothetical protein
MRACPRPRTILAVQKRTASHTERVRHLSEHGLEPDRSRVTLDSRTRPRARTCAPVVGEIERELSGRLPTRLPSTDPTSLPARMETATYAGAVLCERKAPVTGSPGAAFSPQMGRVPRSKEELLAVALSGARKGEDMSRKDERAARLAENESIFRAGNDRIRALVAEAMPRTPYLCECGNENCFERVELTKEEYERVRAHPARFLVLHGHEDMAAGEQVVERHADFAIVEKNGKGREIVTRAREE